MQPRRHWSHRWPVVVPLGLILVLLGPQILGLRSFAPTNMLYLYSPWLWNAPDDPAIRTAGSFADNWDILIPWHVQSAARLLHGDLPLWSPYVAGGGDLQPNLGAMVLAPSTLLWMALPDWYVPGLVKAFEILGAWGFLYLFLRRTGVSRGPATVAGLAFATCGFQVAWFSWPHTVVTMFVAGTLWAWDRVRERPGDPLRLGVGTLMVAATILEGFPAVAVIGLSCAGLVLAVRVLAEWPGWPSALRSAAGVVATAALGGGITMVTLLPFAHLLELLDMDRSVPASFPVQRVIATVLSPNSWGTADSFHGAPFNYIGLVGYLAPAALVVLVSGLVVAMATRRHLALALSAVALGLLLYLFAYGFEPVYSLLRGLPVLSSNAPPRAKAAGALLLACAIGLALDAMLRGGASRRARAVAFGISAVAVGAASASLVLVSQQAPPDQASFIRGEVARAVIVMVLGLAVSGALLWRARPAVRTRRIAVTLLLIIMAVDAVAWIHSYWPSSRPQDFYPETAAHEFVEREVGDERLASLWVTFWPGTNAVYGFRTMAGHQFHRPVWREVILAAGGRMVTRTFSVFDQSKSASSPVLDRFGVRLWADEPGIRHCTTRPPRGSDSAALAPGMTVTVDHEGRAARGIGLRLAEPLRKEATVTVLADDGHSGTARIGADKKAGSLVYVPVPERLDGKGSTTYRIATVTGGPVVVQESGGQPLAGCVKRAPDGLRLEFVEGAQVYRRLHALPRVRWAAAAAVEPDPERRLQLLASGDLDDGTVLLSAGSPTSAQGTGAVARVDDGEDELVATTSATNAGWLVIADPKQDGWLATVDGQPAAVLAADHAGIAVAVPQGEHEVRVWYAPTGLTAGAAISLASLAVTLALLGMGALRHLRPRHSDQDPMARSTDGAPAASRD